MNAQRPIHHRLIIVVITLLLIFGMTGSAPGSFGAAAQAQSFIVQGQNTEAVSRLVVQHGGQVTSRLNIINGVAAQLTEASKATLLADSNITAITPNHIVETAGGVPSTDYPDVIGADLSWDVGARGSGITVAIIDTGLTWHPGLLKTIDKKAKNRIVAWKDFVDGSRLPIDPNGHGSHIAGIIANAEKGGDKEWNGVAPGVNLVGVRVLNAKGVGTYEKVIKGVEWVIMNKDHYNIRVLNLSLLAHVQSPYFADPLNQAVTAAWARGIVVVAAAGNSGPAPMSINVPGNNPYIITVGAFTDAYTPGDWSDDSITSFSAAGPTLDGFVKPDLVAPGAHMVSTMFPTSTIAREHSANRTAAMYFEMAGTSQAAAVVSGVAALVLSEHPNLTPNEVKYRLTQTALPWVNEDGTDAPYSMWQQGAGRVNAFDAVTADISGSANQGLDITADLKGQQHFEGYSYYDPETGTYRLRDGLSDPMGNYGNWAGGFGVWSGQFGVWSGGMGVWSGALGVWSGGMGVWSGSMGVWSGGMGVWSGGMGVWSGGFGVWSGGYDAWTGSEPWAGTPFSSAAFVEDFLDAKPPKISSPSSIGQWVEE